MCSRNRFIFANTGVSNHAAKINGNGGSQPEPRRLLSFKRSKSSFHRCGIGHTRLFAVQ
jgi:hypothetical protein